MTTERVLKHEPGFRTTLIIRELVAGGFKVEIDHLVSDSEGFYGCGLCYGTGKTVKAATDAAVKKYEARHDGAPLVAYVSLR